MRQWKKYGEVWPVGDSGRVSEIRRAAWARLSDEEKAQRIAPMVASIKGQPRSAEHSRRISESQRARWATGSANVPDRQCRGCARTFTPHSGNHWYCGEDCQVARKALRRYGLTVPEYVALMDAQRGVCALCGEKGRGFNGTRYGLVVDHCHTSGRVRGLLCPDCNTALGRFGDDAARLRAAADYLERVT